MKTLTKEQINKLPLDKYIFWLNSMTTPELHEQFPGEFHVLKASDNQNESVTNLLANDAILWKFVKTHAQKLASELTEKESGGKTVEETRKMDKETQCNNIIKKIKETWTPDNRTFEEAELDAKGRKTAGEISKIADEYSELAIKEYPTEIKEGMALHYARGYMACQIELSQFQQPEITNEMIAIYFNNHSDNFIWDGKARKPVQTRSEVIETIRWALSLKVQPERGEQPSNEDIKRKTCWGCKYLEDQLLPCNASQFSIQSYFCKNKIEYKEYKQLFSGEYTPTYRNPKLKIPKWCPLKAMRDGKITARDKK